MTDRAPASPLRSQASHAVKLMTLVISLVMATGAVAASSTTIAPGSTRPDGRTTTAALDLVNSTGSEDNPALVRPDATTAPAPAIAPPGPVLATVAGRAARVIYHGPRTRKVIALTFDDGWSARNGHLILNILERERVPATFFINGVYLAADPDLWREVAEDGFVAGNHTYFHHDVTKMSQAAIIRDLQWNARIWKAVTGQTMAPIFRPPYGARNAASDRAAAIAGYPDVILWDHPMNDTYRLSDYRLLRNAIAGRPGSIVLMHIGPDATPRVLTKVIASYRIRGYTFVTIPQLLPPFHPAPEPKPAPQPEPVPVVQPAARLPEVPAPEAR
jgi:peptidoglycan/xylan/chitin deacetylase (PgdA/CDA1 family)